ncbi:MAG: hypothetical protein PHE51_12690, partial [Eubacteriales bacterium]|nr:hypothetical protein [Eubacteriales bacterium]
ELAEEQKQRLRELLKPAIGDMFILSGKYKVIDVINGLDDENGDYFCYYDNFVAEKEKCLPLLDIGQMIELLENLQFDWFDEICTDEGVYPQPIKGDNLCDALWQAVKQVL